MKRVACALAVVAVVTSTSAAWAASQGARLDGVTSHPAEAAGMSLLAASANVVYFPLRLALTTLTAGVGGITGWLTGGDKAAAESVWESTAGQAFITPQILQGRERLRFGP
jgi:hypothetical protein